MFSPEMKEFIGDRFVMIDLDVIITGDLTELFSRKEDFIIWGDRPMRTPYCGSLMMMNAGARKEVWEKFDIRNYPTNPNGRYPLGTDQNHIYKTIPKEATWTIEDGIYNFGFDIRINDKLMNQVQNKRRSNSEQDRFKQYLHLIINPRIRGGNGELPNDAKLIFFNGKDDPSQLELVAKYPWITEYWK